MGVNQIGEEDIRSERAPRSNVPHARHYEKIDRSETNYAHIFLGHSSQRTLSTPD